MFDTPDIFTPTLECLIVLLFLLGLVFVGGFIPTLSVARSQAAMPERRRLVLSTLAMTEGALGIVLLCSIMGLVAVMRATEISNPNGEFVCLETQLSTRYKIQVTRLGNGTESASAVGPDRLAGISSVELYGIAGNYLVGTAPFDAYFWLDLESGAYRYLHGRDNYVRALELIGVTQPPNLSPATDLCKTRSCVPCSR